MRLDEYLQALKHVSGDCNYREVSAEKCKEVICCFSTWLNTRSKHYLATAFEQREVLEQVQKSYVLHYRTFSEAAASNTTDTCTSNDRSPETQTAIFISCWMNSHFDQKSPACEVICNKCDEKDHFAKMSFSKDWDICCL